ncbi:MAG: hypothetical protein FJ109_11255 [Deltaproteobacteria bacterium]|nr:hypothetical protein [Deltaproteobacteria bacterium]
MGRLSAWFIGGMLAALCVGGCATGRTDEAELLGRGTPLLDRLASGSLSQAGVKGRALLAAARADKALAEARPVDAMNALADALSALPEDALACGTRGLLLYLKGLVASLAGAAAWEAGYKELGEICLDQPIHGPGEADARLFLHALARTDELGGDAGTSAPEQDAAVTSALAGLAQKRKTRELQRIANELGGDRGRVLNALALFLRQVDAVNPDECDVGFASARREGLASSWGELERLGRPDLGLGYWSLAVVGEDGKPRAGDVDRLVDWLLRPENAWLRGDAASRFLTVVRYSADWADPLLTLPVCRVYFDSVRTQAGSDDGEGAVSRNVSRLMSALQAAGACLNPDDVAALTDTVLASAVRDGKSGILSVIGGVAVNLAMTFVDGRTDLIPVVLGQLNAGLERLGGRLTDSGEDRVVAELVRILAAVPPFLQTWSFSELGRELEAAAAGLDKVAARRAGPESPDLERLAPAIRAAAVALLAAEQLVEGKKAEAIASLGRLERTLPGDLSALLAWCGQPDHSAAILRIFAGLRKTVQAADNADAEAWKAAMEALDLASAAGEAERGWWAVGLDAARFLSFDLFAIAAHGNAPDELVSKALVRAEELSTRVADSVSLEVELPPAVEAVLRLLPAAHRAVPMLLGPQEDNLAPRVAALLEQPLRDVLGDTLEDGTDMPGTVADLVIDLLRAAAGVGLTVIIEQPEAAVVRMADHLEKRLARYPGEVRAFLALAVAAGRFLAREDGDPGAFDPVRPLLDRHMRQLSFLPDVIVAAARKKVAPPEELTGLVDRILGQGDHLEACGRGHAVHSLLPYKTMLLARTGRFAEAAETWKRFDALVRKGFAGSGRLSCVLESNSGNVTFTANVGSPIEGFLLQGKQEGTFNLGLGGRWVDGRTPPSGDRLTCSATVPQAVRHDRVAEAHAAFAAYALVAGDDRLAQRALMAAEQACLALQYGSPVTLGKARSAGIEDARSKLDLRLLVWTAMLARLRGHLQSAFALESCALAVGPSTGRPWFGSPEPVEEPPYLLADLSALAGFGVLVASRTTLAADADIDALDKAVRKWNKTAKVAPDWGIRMAMDAFRMEVDRHRGADGFRTPVPDARKAPLGASLATLVNLQLDEESVMTDDLPGAVAAAAGPALDAGLYREVAGAAVKLALVARMRSRAALGLQLLEKVRELIPVEGAEPAHVLAVEMESVLLEDLRDYATLARAYGVLVANAVGMMEPGTEIQRRFQLVRILGQAGDGGGMQAWLSELMPMLHRAVGSGSSDYFVLLSSHAALSLLGRDLEPATARSLAAHGKAINADAAAVRFFELIADSVDSADRKRIATDYLVFQFQGGPMPEKAKEPGGLPPDLPSSSPHPQ